MDRLSTDATLLTIGGEDKTVCRTGDVRIPQPNGEVRWYGPLSWLWGTALGSVPRGSSWTTLLAALQTRAQLQDLTQPLLFHGQPTQHFGPRR